MTDTDNISATLTTTTSFGFSFPFPVRTYTDEGLFLGFDSKDRAVFLTHKLGLSFVPRNCSTFGQKGTAWENLKVITFDEFKARRAAFESLMVDHIARFDP